MANANYLPVLLVSVTTNVVPDDSALSTRPRAQVDYLSHEWQEEDVWRSWRKMTRQKNEITNGIRLENASWRTWWKQRNKLKTVTPETLNWLKDSDVTWLYGPLHTADDDKPLPKPPGIADNTASNQPTASREPPRTTKPILKYRSISELLTSDLPNSPLFSPAESDEEHDTRYDPQLDAISAETFAPGTSLPPPDAFPKRPKLLHTKSDTHITRWGPNRAFRKDSPPRIEPPGHDTASYFPKVSAGGSVRTSLSQDSNSSAGTSTNGEKAAKKKHISFNTFVEQVIAIDKPKRSNSFYTIQEKSWDSRGVYDDDDGYEEDQEDSAEEEVSIETAWSHPRIRSTGVHGYNSPDDIEEEEEEDGIIEMRSSFRHATPKKGPRSQSKASNASSSSSVSTASSTTYSTTTSSSSPSRESGSQSSISTAKRKPLTRRTSSSTYRPNLVRPPPEHVHVTIAPIAPTVLKTTDVWEEGFGDDGAGSDDGFGWRERLWGYNDNPAKTKNKRRKDDEGSDASGTPVELVYVPPFNSRYSYEYSGYGEVEEDDEDDDSLSGLRGFGDDEELEEEDYAGIVHSRPSYHREDSDGAASVYLHRGTAAGSVGFEDYPDSSDKHLIGSPVPGIPIPIPANSVGSDIGRMEYNVGPSNAEAAIPKLVVMEQGKVKANGEEEDEADFFDGDPDYGNEYMPRIHRAGRPGYGSSSRFMIGSDERPSRSTSRTGSSRSRSKSHSRTPSPAMDGLPASNSEPLTRSYSSASPSPNYSTHLLPPTRGRSHQDLLQSSSRTQQPSAQSHSRGRPSARTSGSSSLESSTSPFGGMSPDSANSRYGSASAYGGGGRLDRERDRDRTGGERRGREPFRERERGRDRTTDKRLSVSVSNSPEPPTTSTRSPRIERETSSSATTTTSTTASAEMDSSFVSSASSTSSSKTVIPPGQASPPMTEEDYQREAEEFLRRTGPTPSNSPVIEMRAPPSIPAPVASEQGTPTPSSIAAAAASSPSLNASTPSKLATPASSVPSTSAKAKPPPLAPSPPHPAKPSTSYTAVSSPTNKGNSSPSRLMTSPTTPSSSNVLGIREGSPAGRAGRSKSPQSDSIMGKAAEIAGAFFGLWNHSSASATSPS